MALNDAVEILKELVRIPSVNPAHSSDPDQAGEARMADWLEGFFSTRGFDVERDDPQRPNLIATMPIQNPRKRVMLEAHADTVSVDDMIIHPFDPVLRDGKIFGRGSSDTKGPMAAALAACDEQTLALLKENRVQLVFVGAMGEEDGNNGAIQLAERKFSANECIILEPTDLAVVAMHKGALWYSIELQGTSGHGSGGNAKNVILAMAEVLAFLKSQHAELSSDLKHPLLGVPTLNVGKINGGRAVNIVPEKCRVQIDQRTLPTENSKILRNVLEEKLSQMQDAGAFIYWKIEDFRVGNPFETDADSPMIQTLLNAAQQVGCSAGVAGAPWYSDAGPLSEVCGTTAVFGPGSIRQAHTVDEWIDVDELKLGEKILRRFLRQTAIE